MYAPSQLGSALQDQTKGKFQSLAAGRFPSIVSGTSAGDPANVGGPLGFVVDLFANFTKNVANADPADIQNPDDLHALITDFFDGLPLSEVPIIGDLIEVLTGVEDGNLDDLGTWINQLKTILSGGTVGSGLLPTLSEALRGAVDTVGDFIQNLVNAILQAIRGIPVVGGTLAEIIEDLGGLNDTAVSAQSTAVAAVSNAASVEVHAASLQGQVNSLNSELFYRNNRSLGSGIIPNGESSVDYIAMTFNPTTVVATASSLPWALLRTQSESIKNLVAFYITASVSGSMSAAYADVYVFNEDGTKSYFQSVNFLAQLDGTAQWITFNTADLDVGANATIGVQIRCVGSGSITLRALDFSTTEGIPGMYPGNVGLVRTTNNAPTTVTAGDGVDSGKAIYLEYGNGESGATAAPPLDYYDGFSSALSSSWLGGGTKVDGGDTYYNCGYYISASSGQMRCSYSQFLGRWHYRMFASRVRRPSFEVGITVTSPNSRWSGLVLNAVGFEDGYVNQPDGPIEPMVLMMVKDDTIQLATCTDWEAGTMTVRVSASISSTTATGRWVVDFESATKTYRVYKDGASSPTLTWVDTGSVLTSSRVVGTFFYTANFGQGSPLDDFRYRDTYTV